MLGHTWTLRKGPAFACCLSPREAISSLLNDSQPLVEDVSHTQGATCASVSEAVPFSVSEMKKLRPREVD